MLLLLHRNLLLRELRELLLEALAPVAEAMQRQDQLHQDHQMVLLMDNQQQTELLEEILSSLQPSAQTQIYQQLGLLNPIPSSLNSAS